MLERLVSIPEAEDARGFVFHQQDIGIATIGRPVRCHGCRVQVKVVPPAVRRDGTKVRGYFSLIDRREGDHADDCPFAFDARVGKLVIQHATELERHGTTYVLVVRHPLDPSPDASKVPAPSNLQRVVVASTTGIPALRKTLQAATAVVRLLREFDNHPQAVGSFKATWRGRAFGWREFCYPAGKAATLNSALTPDPKRPIAVHGTTSRPVSESKKGDSWALELDSGGDPQLAVIIRSKRRVDLDFAVGAEVLGYGLWRVYVRTNGIREIQLWCDANGAVAGV